MSNKPPPELPENHAVMAEPTGAARVRFLVPLALAQFICSFAGSNMNVMINDITTLKFEDLPSRARAFGVISGLGGIGAAAGPLIGGLITRESAGGPRSSSRSA